VNRRRSLLFLAIAILQFAVAPLPTASPGATAAAVPERLSDREFWNLVTELSEPNGEFRSDNLLSNEIYFQYVLNDLAQPPRMSRAYLGVGPEQNFTYIAALKPKIAFIVDVRRGNLHLHLMYKALFEMASDRADFVFKLFSRRKPAGLSPKPGVNDIFEAVDREPMSEALLKENLKAILDHLTKKRGFALTPEDHTGIEYVYANFSWHGPGLSYWSSGRSSMGGMQPRAAPTYWDLMVADDGKGQMRSFLANDENFLVLKELHEKNLLVPVVGNFAGPKALRAVGRYLRERDATVAAFYLSNVEQYLQRDSSWYVFCGNAATLPLDEHSKFIRSVRNGTFGPGIGLDSELGDIAEQVKGCAAK
jgi:hypothetical protein